MREIAPPIDKSVLKQELKKVNFVRPTNNGGNEIYIFTASQSEILMTEVGRLREVSFRSAGGGTGKELDIDHFDRAESPYLQLIVWDPEDEAMIGGYRYILCKDAIRTDGTSDLSTQEIFKYSEKMKTEYFPLTIELGRSWVQPNYQPKPGNRAGLFSLDNLWDGLGALIIMRPEIEYFFGKVTMYPTYNAVARDHLLSFMHKVFPDREKLLDVENVLTIDSDCSEMLKKIEGLDYKASHAILNQTIRSLGENIPPLFNSYMNLSPTMKTFPTSVNSHFGGVEETGIMIRIADIYDTKKSRHLESYQEYLNKK